MTSFECWLSKLTLIEWIQITGLIILFAYTTFAALLWWQQRKNFELAQRPWVLPTDISFHNDRTNPQLAVFLYNFGKLPALCRISVPNIRIKPLPSDEWTEVLKANEPFHELTVFPHVQSVDSKFMYIIPLTAEQNDVLLDNASIEMEINIKYGYITKKSSRLPYTYSATLEVRKFERTHGIQSTLIRDTTAS